MGVSVDKVINGVRCITVTGELCDEIEIEEFFNILDQQITTETQVTFLDASTLEAAIIEKLADIQSARKLEISVVKSYLYSYMYKLGIRCKYNPMRNMSSGIISKKLQSAEVKLGREEVLYFLENINKKYGYDYTEYQVDSIMRRIKISMLRANTDDFTGFQNLVLENDSYFEQLFLDFSINTTEFFRNPEVFQVVKNKVLLHLNSYSHIRIWCIGCSTGKEPYSLAILLEEAGLLHKVQIYATDINPYVIEEAKNGMYSMDDIEEGIQNYRKAGGENSFTSYFELKGNYIKIKQGLKKNILFFQHSILGNGIINEFHLILCRNVLIYFNNSLQKKVLRYLSYSLDKNGFLVLGKSGGILQNGGYNYFTKYDEINKIYKKKELV